MPLLHWKLSQIPFVILVLCICGCNSEPSSPYETVNVAIQKLRDANAINYDYRQEADNRFNETTHYDSAYISWFRVDNSHHGFGLQIDYGNFEYQYDGQKLIEFDHSQKTRLLYDQSEIASDSNYFESIAAFSINPIRFANLQHSGTTHDTMLDTRSLIVRKSETRSQSKSDESEEVIYQTFWFVDPVVAELTLVQSIIIRAGDTLQVVNHHFSDYSFGSSGGIASDNDRNTSTYKTVFGDNVTTPPPIRIGDLLEKRIYTDSEQNTVAVYGESQAMSMIMFSFIGCAPCERALKDLGEMQYAFAPGHVGYYSSFQNPGDVLGRYLAAKGCPLTAFGRESQMIDDFNLYFAPTFVFIDSTGSVVQIMEGYDDEVKEEVMGLMGVELGN